MVADKSLKKNCRVKWKFNIPSVFRPVRSPSQAYISVFFSLCLAHMHTLTQIYTPISLSPSLLFPNSHYSNESHSVLRVKLYHGVTRFVLLKKRLSSRGWRSEIAGKFFTSGRHESYNSTVQRGPSSERVGMNRYQNEEQCAIAKPEIARREKIFCWRDFVECQFHREMMDASA